MTPEAPERCPVCGEPLVRDVSYLGHGTVAECYESCGRCGYASEYAYGSGSEFIGEARLDHTWTETPEEEMSRRKARADAIRRRQGELRKQP